MNCCLKENETALWRQRRARLRPKSTAKTSLPPCAAVTHSFVLKTRWWFSFNSACKRSRRLTSRSGCGPQTGPASVRWMNFIFLASFQMDLMDFRRKFSNYWKIHLSKFLKIETIDLHLIGNVYSVAVCFKKRRRFRSARFRVSLRRSGLKMNETGNEVPKWLVVKLEN